MKKFNKLTLSLILFFIFHTNTILAQEVSDAWMRKPHPTLRMAAIYLKIKNTLNKDITLINVTGEDAEKFEIHTHKNIDGVMKMRKLNKLLIPAQKTIHLKPMGDHIMVFNFKKEKIESSQTQIGLEFNEGIKTQVQVLIKED